MGDIVEAVRKAADAARAAVSHGLQRKLRARVEPIWALVRL